MKTDNKEFPALPGLEGVSGGYDPREPLCYLASIAVSLKRIADAVDGTALGCDITEGIAGVTLEIARHRP